MKQRQTLRRAVVADLPFPFFPCHSYFSPAHGAVPGAHSRSICTVLWGLILNLPCQSPTSFLQLQNPPHQLLLHLGRDKADAAA